MVFSAENVVSGEKCAIKIIPLGGRAGARELRALRQYHNVSHPNLLRIHHSGITGDFLYYTMDPADGKLAELHLPPSRLRTAGIKLADALAALHEHGLIHRDLKPDNLFYRKDEPLIGDIGLVTSDCGASLSGTPGFLSPAVQKDGAALSERSDLYALAKSFYCLLSGNPPGDYPAYAGPMEEDSAILLHAVLAICDDSGEITSAAGLRDFLLTGKRERPRRRMRALGTAGILLFLTALVAAGAVEVFSRPPSRNERITSFLKKAERRSPEEQNAIDLQQKVFSGLLQKAKKQTAERFPRKGKNTSVNAEMKRFCSSREQLSRLVREQAEKSPEFRCFFVLRDDLDQTAEELHWFLKHPEYAADAENRFQLWQQKYATYCKARDLLLKQH